MPAAASEVRSGAPRVYSMHWPWLRLHVHHSFSFRHTFEDACEEAREDAVEVDSQTQGRGNPG
jgi:hypothetical protein